MSTKRAGSLKLIYTEVRYFVTVLAVLSTLIGCACTRKANDQESAPQKKSSHDAREAASGVDELNLNVAQSDAELFETFCHLPGPRRFSSLTKGSPEWERAWLEWTRGIVTISGANTSRLEALLDKVSHLESSTMSPSRAGQPPATAKRFDEEEVNDLLEKAFWLNRMVFIVPEVARLETGIHRYSLSMRTKVPGGFRELYPFATGPGDTLYLVTNQFGMSQIGGPPPMPVLEFREFSAKYERRVWQ